MDEPRRPLRRSRVEVLLTDLDAPTPLVAATRSQHKAVLRALVQREAGHELALVRTHDRSAGWSQRRAILVVSLAAMITSVGGAAVAYLHQASPTHVDMVRCFGVAAPPFAPGPDNISGVRGGATEDSAHAAIDLCAAEWGDGVLPDPQSADPVRLPSGGPFPVPELHACVLPDGYVGVFPGGKSVCLNLGLPKALA